MLEVGILRDLASDEEQFGLHSLGETRNECLARRTCTRQAFPIPPPALLRFCCEMAMVPAAAEAPTDCLCRPAAARFDSSFNREIAPRSNQSVAEERMQRCGGPPSQSNGTLCGRR